MSTATQTVIIAGAFIYSGIACLVYQYIKNEMKETTVVSIAAGMLWGVMAAMIPFVVIYLAIVGRWHDFKD